MVIDTSALVAILRGEAEARRFAEAIEAGTPRLVSAATLLETSIVIESYSGEAGGRELDLLLHRAGIEVVPVDAEQAELARIAYRRFGKGRNTAGLNYGDCFSYARAKATGEPLLFKGDDFRATDVSAC
jgi:ribonuclease VapC